MKNVHPTWLHAVLLFALLSGCAATKLTGEDGRPATTAKPHSFTRKFDTLESSDQKETKKEDKSATGELENVKLYPGTGVFVKSAPTLASNIEGGEDVMLNFDGADLREVVKIVLVDIMHESYLIDPRVQGVVNIHSSHPVKRSALVPTLEAVLRMNGASLVRESDGVFHVNPFATATKGALTPQVGDMNKPLPPGYSVQIIPLKYISAREMIKILEPFTPEGGVVRVDDMRNMLLLGGNARELHHLMETIDIFDVDWIAGMSVGLFTLKSVDVKIAFSEIEKIFGDKTQGPLAGVLRIIPIERLNALLVVTPQPKYLEQARLWMERLDRSGATDGGVQLYVYQVQNGNAVKMANLLGQAFSKQASMSVAPPPSLAPGLNPVEIKSSGPVTGGAQGGAATGAAQSGGSDSVAVSVGGTTKIIADKENNALLILSTPSEYEIITNAIRKLDVVPRQVLIEVTIAEVTLSDEFSFGLEWYFNNGAKGKGFLDTGSAGITQLSPGFSYAWLDPAGSIKAVLNALAANSKLNIISSPHVMVSDNQTAKIQVGDRVPTVSQTQALAAVTTTTGVISSVQYLDTGIMLSVTPHINAGGLVTMEISQEVSNAVKTVTSGIDSPTISKRSAQSTVTVQSGETMVLGGLISDKKSNANSGLPFLSEVPVLGSLFGAQNIKDDRTELVMMITPKLVANSQQAKGVTDEFRKKIGNVTLEHTKD